ncbi:MAG: hypothetical protein A2571_03620 [Candidatus Vogelbacteria bacterium RIFOXYD1_FULL_44_32]|uniref:D-alanyl-D-alanine carboxypeptidase-like core domain-containing protein n=1 Tax=Candidatus Vogelbacteria bacterium RIFOXYD1_FULL_44_32 TaxID=1802438 RepID=A0A1G2QDR2_9BACT|nr:MAG: hypothetical protein A2571_03620 [Candidatus Vogelbacteria bacterium RIFOXYD1_FULL_44_32]
MSLKNNEIWFWFCLMLVLVGAASGGGFFWFWQEVQTIRLSLASSTAALKTKNEEIIKLTTEASELAAVLNKEKNKNNEFEEQINEINDTVGTLEKWSKTDPELLQKYSKIFFLNENYSPAELKDIDSEYLYDKTKTLQIHAEVESFLVDMLQEASEDGVDLQVVSAFRSFGYQSQLKNSYAVVYGAGTANQFSADQGYSEHQLGTTLDFTILGKVPFVGFDTTEGFKWLQANAYKFGFVLSYPKGNVYYQYEPWHWRFVGENLARDLNRSGKFFYDLDQRALDPYLVKLFD